MPRRRFSKSTTHSQSSLKTCFFVTMRAADAAATGAAGCCLDMVTCWLLLHADCRTEVPKHHHVLQLALCIFFGPVNMTQ